jgi:hypothetical protein
MAYESEVIQHELEDEYSGEGEWEMEDEYEDESSLEGEGWLGAIGNVVGSLLGESEDEYEDESAFEAEAEEEISPIRKIYPDAMMEHLGELAFEAESEDEAAEQFLPLIGMAASKLLPVAARAIAPLAKKALPKIARAVTKATPQLTRGIGKVAKTLYRTPQTRHLLKTVPAIARRTVGSIARQAAHGRHITPRTAAKTLARQTRHVLAHPGHRRHALRRHAHLERTFHRRYAAGMARPHQRYAGRPGYRYGAATPQGVPGYVASGAPGYRAGVAPGYAASGYAAPGYAVPGAVYQPGVAAGHPRYGTCTCAPCPSCRTNAAQAAAAASPVAAPTPAQCHACGQAVR